MRILQAHNRHGSRGGADHVVDLEARLLREAGHEVGSFFTAPATPSGPAGAVRSGLDAIWNVREVARLVERLETWRPDVLHVHTPFPVMSPAVFRAATSCGIGTVGTVHSFRYSCIAGTLYRDGAVCEDCIGQRVKLPGLRHRCYHGSVAASAALTLSLAAHRGTITGHVDRFLPLTDVVADLMVRDGVDRSRVTVKPNCVPTPAGAAEAADRAGALFVGRLVEEKGVATLIEAWRRHRPPVRLRVVGDGPLRPLVEAAAAEGVLDFDGWLEPAEVARRQAAAAMVLVTSQWYEAGPPLVLLQALASGTPVVCSDLPNLSADAVSAGAARAFRTGDADDLARVVTAFAGEPAALDAAGAAGRALHRERHTPEATVATLERVYGEVRR